MQPLRKVEQFLKRFDNFKDGEVRSIDVVSPLVMNITLTAQDVSRSFDWISLKLECSGVSDARLLDNTKLSLLDMSEGISIIESDNKLAIGLGSCYNIQSIKNSSFFIECASIKFEENEF